MTPTAQKNTNRPFILFGIAATVMALLVIAASSWLFYNHTTALLTDNLRQRLLAIVTTAVVEFDPHDVERLRVESDWKRPEWAKVVNQLKKIRENNQDILFAYMFRKSAADPTKMEFVSDSHSINPFAKIDINGDGKIDSADQLQWPGQPYPTAPVEAFEAYAGPTTNRAMYEDQWGKVLTGYAPLKDEQGHVVAIIAMDIRARDFSRITTQTLIPFVLFSSVLVVIILALSISIIKVGRSRIDLLQEIDQQKNNVISIVAHQLNSLVTGFQWAAEMLRSGDVAREECAATIETETAELRDLSGMFLEASHIQKGMLQLHPTPLDLNTFFQTLISSISIRAAQKHIQLTTSIPPALPTVLLDPKYTQLTLENLLGNAVKYTDRGKVDFTVAIANNTLYCTVRDTGRGIPRQDQDRIFGQMYRASNAGTAGNGLGLYAARGAIEAQGGTIRFESTEGAGTTFFVELPLALAVIAGASRGPDA